MKDVLKEIKLNESSISMALGAIIVLVAGILLITQFRDNTPQITNFNSIVQNDIAVNEPVNIKENNEVYIVEPGDSLWTISEKKYGTGYEWSKLAQANGISNPESLEVGQELVIPTAQSISGGEITEMAAATEAAETEVAQQAETAIQASEYIVQRGDNLWNISVQIYGDGYRWKDIATDNNLIHPEIIHAGNKLTLPS